MMMVYAILCFSVPLFCLFVCLFVCLNFRTPPSDNSGLRGKMVSYATTCASTPEIVQS